MNNIDEMAREELHDLQGRVDYLERGAERRLADTEELFQRTNDLKDTITALFVFLTGLFILLIILKLRTA